MGGGTKWPYCQEIGCHLAQKPPRSLKTLDFFWNYVESKVVQSFWVSLEWLSRNQAEFAKNLPIFWGENNGNGFFSKFSLANLPISLQILITDILRIFWSAACLSSSKIDESRIFDYDFLWRCHLSVPKVAEAKLMTLATSTGYQMKTKHYSFHMRFWLLM